MNMSFERLRIQTQCEGFVNCSDLNQWHSYRSAFEDLTLNPTQVSALKAVLYEDAKDLYYKGLLSLSEAISAIYRSLYSWATVKAYYSVFYLLRSSLALKEHVIVRNKSLYLLRIKDGEKPLKRTSDRYRNDHVCVINIYQDLYKDSDPLQSNTIDGINPYEWMMDRRSQINYRQREFLDPMPPAFLQSICESVKEKKFYNILEDYMNDVSLLYCFQSDHACLALPIQRLLMTRQEFANTKIRINFPSEKFDLIRDLLSFGPGNTEQFRDVISNFISGQEIT